MAEPEDAPTRPGGAPQFLPRLKYTPPEPEPDTELEEGDGLRLADEAGTPRVKGKPSAPKTPANPSRPGAKAPKPKPSADRVEATPPKPKKPASKTRSRIDDPPDSSRGVLVEATPEAETFEGRRRIRLLVGGIAVGILLLSLFVVWRSLRSTETESDTDRGTPEVAAEVRPPPKSPDQIKAEAERLLTEARQLEKAGKPDDAFAKVEAVLADYADTPSAQIAAAARERFRQGLPLFPSGAAVIATKADSKVPDPTDDGDPPVDAPDPAAPSRPSQPIGSPGRTATLIQPGLANPAVVADPAPANVASRPLPAGFRSVQRAGLHALGWPLEIVSERDGGKLVLVPGGRFTQGRDDGKPEERPAHAVQLSPFYIHQHEVTARQFAAFRPGKTPADVRPAVNVSLADARAYAEWAGLSIPTEAQWEMAARATDGRVHPWGNAPPDFGGRRQPKQIDPVMSFPGDQSPYGAFDLAGNAWEWTNDWFDAKYYTQLKGQAVVNPTGPARGSGRLPEVVIKGGSKDWDASWRSGMRADAKLPYLGFRCVLNLGAGAPGGAEAAPARPDGTPGSVPF